MNLIEIAKAWIAAAHPTPEQQKTADTRIATCNECPSATFTSHLNIHVCGCIVGVFLFIFRGGILLATQYILF
jgi:hypothetical protein